MGRNETHGEMGWRQEQERGVKAKMGQWTGVIGGEVMGRGKGVGNGRVKGGM